MKKLSALKDLHWEKLVAKAFGALDDVSRKTPRYFYYSPAQIGDSQYQLTPPEVTVAPEVNRVVVRFRITNSEGPARRTHADSVVAFDENLSVVAGETTTMASRSQTTSPFFTASLIPRAPGGSEIPVVNSLAIAAFGVGLLAAAIAQRRLSAADDTDLSLRLLPHYTNLVINQVQNAMRVAALGGGLDDVARVAALVKGALGKAIHDWPEDGWDKEDGKALERETGGETVRLWRPTLATFVNTHQLVLKFDHDTSGKDDHVAATVLFHEDGRVLSVIGDAYLTSRSTFFTVEKQAEKNADPLPGWIDEMRKRSVQAGRRSLQFVTGVGELLTGLTATVGKVKREKVKIGG